MQWKLEICLKLQIFIHFQQIHIYPKGFYFFLVLFSLQSDVIHGDIFSGVSCATNRPHMILLILSFVFLFPPLSCHFWCVLSPPNEKTCGVSSWFLFYLTWWTPVPFISLQLMTLFIAEYNSIINTYFIYPPILWWAPRLIPQLGYWE